MGVSSPSLHRECTNSNIIQNIYMYIHYTHGHNIHYSRHNVHFYISLLLRDLQCREPQLPEAAGGVWGSGRMCSRDASTATGQPVAGRRKEWRHCSHRAHQCSILLYTCQFTTVCIVIDMYMYVYNGIHIVRSLIHYLQRHIMFWQIYCIQHPPFCTHCTQVFTRSTCMYFQCNIFLYVYMYIHVGHDIRAHVHPAVQMCSA